MADWDQRFLDLAKLVAGWSKDPSTQTGAVIVRPDRRIVSVAYNGFPQAMPDDEAMYADREEKLSRIIHCEINALIFARQPVNDCTLYTWPFISCDRCAVVMIQAGITRFVAPRARNDLQRWAESFERVRKYARECGVEVVEL